MKTRILWLDYLRTISIFLVVLTHILEEVYKLTTEEILINNDISGFLVLNIFNLTRHAVPIFLMISGYLLLSRKYTLKSCNKLDNDTEIYSCCGFWRNNLLKLFITIEIWIVIYNLFFVLLDKKEFDLIKLIKQMLLIEGCDLSHEWYMYMILGVYIFIPFVSYILDNVELKNLIIPIVITIVVCFLLPTLSVFLETCGIVEPTENPNLPSIASKVELNYSGGVYGIYLLCGYLVKKGVFSKIKSSYLVFVSVACFSIGSIFQWGSFLMDKAYFLWYDFITLLPTSVVVFELFSRCHFEAKSLKNIIINLSKSSFGIYLIHNLILKLLLNYLPLNDKLYINVFVYSVITFLLSWLIVNLLRKIPVIGKHIVYA